MLVARSFQYASSPPKEVLDEKPAFFIRRSSMPQSHGGDRARQSGLKPASPARTTTEPARVPTPPIPVRTSGRSQSAKGRPTLTSSAPDGRTKTKTKTSSVHNANALPPAVAALLAVTHIPRPKPGQFPRERAKGGRRRISIDELVSEWKNDESLNTSYGSSPGLSVLLEDDDRHVEAGSVTKSSVAEDGFSGQRSTSSESVPSLDADDRSILSQHSPSTPGSLRSRKSLSNLKRQSSRSVPTTVECDLNHPLAAAAIDDEDPDDGFILSPTSNIRTTPPKPKAKLTSNLTTSLQALKNAALSSISSLSLGGSNSSTKPGQRPSVSPFSDDVLWSHPFLFPRLSSEIRPAIDGNPTSAQRRYLNPAPLSFEEQERPYQQALHAPYLAEPIQGALTIPMQTYGIRGGKRKANTAGNTRRSTLDPESELGRAVLGAAGMRQRELRENSDFLRVVVLEMNMKREGKLETGKARIWLPPRQDAGIVEDGGKVPRRWVGESAY